MTKPSPPATSTTTTAAATTPRRTGQDGPDTENLEHHEPHRGRQVGQRRGVHPHHRADRRLGHRRARARVPAQQRADRLHDRLRPGRPEPDRAGQAAALVDVADDRAARRQAGPRARLPGRLDDHHDRAADAVQPDRPRHEHRSRRSRRRGPRSATPPRHRQGHTRRAGVHRPLRRRARRPYGHTFAPPGPPGTAPPRSAPRPPSSSAEAAGSPPSPSPRAAAAGRRWWWTGRTEAGHTVATSSAISSAIGTGSAGSVKISVVPCPSGPSRAEIRPPWRSTARAQMASPRPVPG